MATDQGRLQQIYGEMGDEHLLDMADDIEDLTDEGRVALMQELRRRGLAEAEVPVGVTIIAAEEPERESGFSAGIPGIFPASAAMMEQALDEARTSKDGMSSLISFYDGIELSKACGILEDAEVDPVIEPIEGDALTGVPPRFEVWLETGDIEHAKILLRLKMGLFPVAEVDGEAEATTGLVGVFENAAEAEEARTMLANAEIISTLVSNADEDTGDVAWEVMVESGEQERAIAVVAQGMGLQEG